MSQLFFDTFGSLAGNHSEANLHVEWQVYDVFRRQVVFGVPRTVTRNTPVHWDLCSTIAADRLTTKGFGDTRPSLPNTRPAGRAQNRRVEIVKQ